ncbi:hypothetical protein Bca4012_099819 [Brassica carinata]
MAITQLHFSDLKAGRLGNRVVTSCKLILGVRREARKKTSTVSRGELTFQDIYGAEALLNEEDEDGYSDWEPVQQKMPVEFVKWCCFNCTMANPASAIICLRHMDILHLCYLKDTGLSPKSKRNVEEIHLQLAQQLLVLRR